VVVVIALLALCVAGVTIWSVVTVVGHALDLQGLAALVLVVLALGLGTFALMRRRTR
jgi:preprotein translocase subunit SecD